ncbi:MAG: signal transduction histidine kinase, partial [Myxococcota bacterium]
GPIGHSIAEAAEVQAALAGQVDIVVRPRQRTSAPLSSASRRAGVRLFVAVPVDLDGERLGAIVISRTPREEMQALYHMAGARLVLGVGLALLLTVTMALFAGWLLSRSLRVTADGAERIAEGAFDELDAMHLLTRSRVAEVGRLAAAVSTMTDRLRARLAYISEFASNVSHEFRTPLSTIRGTLELLGDDAEMPPAQRAKFMANATAELDRLERLVTGLLELARAEESRERRPVDLGALVCQVAGRHAVAVEGEASEVSGDRVQLEAVAENLVANARRHGGPSVVVRLWTTPDATGFEVEDDGPGISPANQARVFERFFTTRRGTGGTGLGLALTRAVVRAHAGEVMVESAPGRTLFRVAFPRIPS